MRWDHEAFSREFGQVEGKWPALGVSDKRSALRTLAGIGGFRITGAFAASLREAECDAIYTAMATRDTSDATVQGVIDAEMANWTARLSGAPVATTGADAIDASEVPMPDEGAVEVKADDGAGVLDVTLDPDILAALDELKPLAQALTLLSPERGNHASRLSDTLKAELERMAKAATDAQAIAREAQGRLVGQRSAAIKIDANGRATFKVGKDIVNLPIVERPGDDASMVPMADAGYQWAMLNLSVKVGPHTVKSSLQDFVALLERGEVILLTGAPGVGKTSAIMQLAGIAKWPVVRFQGDKSRTAMDFVGGYEARGGSTVWVDGPLVQAMRLGALIVIDEYDHMPSECSSVAHAPLERDANGTRWTGGLRLPTGEYVTPDPRFRVVLTANTKGFGDETGRHPGASVQDDAMQSRIGATFNVAYPLAPQERKMLRDIGMDATSASVAVNIARDSRDAVENGSMTHALSPRQTMAWARHFTTLGDLKRSFVTSCLARFDAANATALIEIAQRHMGSDLGTLAAAPTDEADGDNN